jgi:hypothetical protein
LDEEDGQEVACSLPSPLLEAALSGASVSYLETWKVRNVILNQTHVYFNIFNN